MQVKPFLSFNGNSLLLVEFTIIMKMWSSGYSTAVMWHDIRLKCYYSVLGYKYMYWLIQSRKSHPIVGVFIVQICSSTSSPVPIVLLTDSCCIIDCDLHKVTITETISNYRTGTVCAILVCTYRRGYPRALHTCVPRKLASLCRSSVFVT